jgi:hypothetical protein
MGLKKTENIWWEEIDRRRTASKGGPYREIANREASEL